MHAIAYMTVLPDISRTIYVETFQIKLDISSLVLGTNPHPGLFLNTSLSFFIHVYYTKSYCFLPPYVALE